MLETGLWGFSAKKLQEAKLPKNTAQHADCAKMVPRSGLLLGRLVLLIERVLRTRLFHENFSWRKRYADFENTAFPRKLFLTKTLGCFAEIGACHLAATYRRQPEKKCRLGFWFHNVFCSAVCAHSWVHPSFLKKALGALVSERRKKETKANRRRICSAAPWFLHAVFFVSSTR